MNAFTGYLLDTPTVRGLPDSAQLLVLSTMTKLLFPELSEHLRQISVRVGRLERTVEDMTREAAAAQCRAGAPQCP